MCFALHFAKKNKFVSMNKKYFVIKSKKNEFPNWNLNPGPPANPFF